MIDKLGYFYVVLGGFDVIFKLKTLTRASNHIYSHKSLWYPIYFLGITSH
jgi:hypothetical protein